MSADVITSTQVGEPNADSVKEIETELKSVSTIMHEIPVVPAIEQREKREGKLTALLKAIQNRINQIRAKECDDDEDDDVNCQCDPWK